MEARLERRSIAVSDYHLERTLESGQAFRWQRVDDAWEGVIGRRWVRLTADSKGLNAEAYQPGDWHWLEDYLQTGVDLASILRTFPPEDAMQCAVRECAGLRLLRQDPWECLASFILSSSKQIVQIRQIVEALCLCFGEPVLTPPGHPAMNAFPRPDVIAAVSETSLRNCKMGFRAPYLHAAARSVANGQLDLAAVGRMPLESARAELIKVHGVGRKIADCVLLFAYGFPMAFLIDVWVMKALRKLYFRNRKIAMPRLLSFSEKHFGPNAGYAQQYLFHHIRTQAQARP